MREIEWNFEHVSQHLRRSEESYGLSWREINKCMGLLFNIGLNLHNEDTIQV